MFQRLNWRSFDWLLLGVVLVLCALSIAMIYSATANTDDLADYWVRQALGDLIFSGVFERFPSLRVVSAEHEVGWLPFFVERMDYTYTQRATKGHRFADGALPSDFVRRNVWVQFCEDPLAAAVAQSIGSDRLLWGSDYPHSEGLFPRSREVFADRMASLDATARQRIAAGNAAALYSIPASLYSIDGQ